MNIGAHGSGFNRVDPRKVKMCYLSNGSTTNMAVDGSVNPESFSYTPPAGKGLTLCKIHIFMKTNTNFDDEKFGHVTALKNGISIKANNEEVANIKCNRDFTVLLPEWKTAVGNEDKSITGDWNFDLGGDCQGLDITPGNSFEFIIQDDLTEINLTLMAMIKGKIIG